MVYTASLYWFYSSSVPSLSTKNPGDCNLERILRVYSWRSFDPGSSHALVGVVSLRDQSAGFKSDLQTTAKLLPACCCTDQESDIDSVVSSLRGVTFRLD